MSGEDAGGDKGLRITARIGSECAYVLIGHVTHTITRAQLARLGLDIAQAFASEGATAADAAADDPEAKPFEVPEPFTRALVCRVCGARAVAREGTVCGNLRIGPDGSPRQCTGVLTVGGL